MGAPPTVSPQDATLGTLMPRVKRVGFVLEETNTLARDLTLSSQYSRMSPSDLVTRIVEIFANSLPM